MDTRLILADGTTFDGVALGGAGPVVGEVVFNTSMTGYQEILSDPSYCGQIVVLTAPQIGNTGVNALDMEAARPWASGLIVREVSGRSNWRAEAELHDLLRAHGVPGVSEIDTRALTRHLRDRGAMNGIIAPMSMDRREAEALLAAAPDMTGCDLVPQVTCAEPYRWEEGQAYALRRHPTPPPIGARPHVVAMDFGLKRSILRNLVDAGFAVTVVPAQTPADAILTLKPDGVFLSNGPGDPAAVTYAIDAVRVMLGRVPIFGICLGHQILALALGARTYKLKFGHHGGNHPVMDLTTGEVEITAHNHGFAVDEGALPPGMRLTQLNLNDRTVEGFEFPERFAIALQYHPEAGPGPRDAVHHFRRFRDLIEAFRRSQTPA